MTAHTRTSQIVPSAPEAYYLPLGNGRYDQLAEIGKNPIVATDADIAGRVAAERDFWILAAYGLDPRYAQLPEGSDPADLFARYGPDALNAALDHARLPGDELMTNGSPTCHPIGPNRGNTGRRGPAHMLG
jgi:hypothetical protein